MNKFNVRFMTVLSAINYAGFILCLMAHTLEDSLFFLFLAVTTGIYAVLGSLQLQQEKNDE